MRQWNKELNEFAEMQKRLGDNAPYKTLGSFRRAYRSKQGSLAYAKSHYYRKDEREYSEFENVIGKENMPETLEKFQLMKYNEDRRFDLFHQYKESVKNNKVDNIGFAEFEKVLKEANAKIIGVKTSIGVTVEGITYHLIERIIGSKKEKRIGVSIENVIEALETGICDGVIKYSQDGKRSVIFKTKKAYVSFNIDNNTVVQCIPKTRGKK